MYTWRKLHSYRALNRSNLFLFNNVNFTICLIVWIYFYLVGSRWRRWTSIWSIHVKRYTSQKNSGWCHNGKNSGQEDWNRVADVWYIMLSVLCNRFIKYKASGQEGAVLYFTSLRFINIIYYKSLLVAPVLKCCRVNFTR